MAGLVLKITLDKTEAQKALNEFAAQVATTLGKSLPKSGGGGGGTSGGGNSGGGTSGGGTGGNSSKGDATSFLKKLSDAMDKASEKQKKFGDEQLKIQKSLESTAKLDALRSWYSDLRDVLDIGTTSMLGFSQAQAQAASQSLYLAEKGLALSSVFGIQAGIMGATVGVILGLTHYYIENEKAITALNTKVHDSADEFRTWIASVKDFDQFDPTAGVKALVAEFDALQKKIETGSFTGEGIFDWITKEGKNAQIWMKGIGIEGNLYAETILKIIEMQKQFTESQKTTLSLQAIQFYQESADAAVGLVDGIDKVIDSQNELGRDKTFKEMKKATADAKAELLLAREATKDLAIDLAVLKTKQQGRLLSEQDKKDLKEMEELYKAADKSVKEKTQTFIKSATEENTTRDRLNKEAAKKRKEEQDLQQEQLGQYMKNVKTTQDKQLALYAKGLQDRYKVNQYWLSREHALQVEWDAQILHSQLESQQKALDEEKAAREEHFAEVQTLAENSLGIASDFLSGFTAQLEENIAAEEKAFKNFGLVARQGVANVLKSLGKEWAARAIAEFAQGLAFLAVGDAASAGTAFAAGSTYGIAAAAAGVGGAVIGGRATAEANRRSAAEEEKENKRKDKSRGGSGNGASSGGGGRGVSTSMVSPIILNMNGNVFPTANERDAATFGTSLLQSIAAAQRGSFDSTGMH